MSSDLYNKKNATNEAKIEDYAKRTLELYDDTSKNFWRTFWIVIASGVFFFFMILLPFVMLQQQNYDVDLQLNQTIIKISNNNESKIKYKEVEDKINQLKDSTSHGAENLRMYIINTEKLYDDSDIRQYDMAAPAAPTAQTGGPSISDEPEDQGHPNCVGFLPGNNASTLDNTSIYNAPVPKDNWLNCNVLEQLKDQFNSYNDTLSQNLLSLPKEVNDSSVSDQIYNMSKDAEKLRDDFNTAASKQIKENPTFWKDYSGKSEFYNSLTTKVDEFKNNLSAVTGILSTKIEDLAYEKINLENEKNTTGNNKEELANRLNGMEFPFGRIPIGLNESVAVFPIAIAAGFAIFCYFLGNTIQLRKALHEWYKNKDPNTEVDLKKKIPHIAPLWIDPTHSINNKIIRLAILMVPFAIFIISWYLISYGWTKILDEDMRTTFPYDQKLYTQFYQGLYIFSLIFLVMVSLQSSLNGIIITI
jgi:hypothetical protein